MAEKVREQTCVCLCVWGGHVCVHESVREQTYVCVFIFLGCINERECELQRGEEGCRKDRWL